MIDFFSLRGKMVDSQLRTTDVTSHSVLNAFLDIPREDFVPEALKPLAYIDDDLEIAPGRFLMKPSPLGKLLQLAEITKQDFVLEIGTGSGYTTALLARLSAAVVTVESDSALQAQAKANLHAPVYAHVSFVSAPLEEGYAVDSPYDLIFINGAVEHVPQALLNQLRPGGRLIAVIGYGNVARATQFVKIAGSETGTPFFNASIPALPGFRKAREFVF